MALELNSNQLVFSFPNIHEGAKLTIEFQRTLRIPDDGKTYPLPPGFGMFPVKHTDDYLDKLPTHWKEHGGVFLPIYQAEAMWIRFQAHTPARHAHAYPFAVKIGTGKKSALTGKEWEKGLHKKDYCVVPEQPWLDGYVIEEGVIAQFVAVPLGQGLTVEEQLGGEGVGGIQIEVFPMKAECFERRWPKLPPPPERLTKGIRCRSLGAGPAAASYSFDCLELCDSDARAVGEMGLGAGGRMKQQVFEDPYGKDEWARNIDSTRRCFVHLANSMAWEGITGERPPETPVTAAAYERYNYPWFDYYSDDLQAMKGGKKFTGVKTVKDKAAEKGLPGVLPENQSVQPKNILVIPAKAVRNGSW
jgi:hypothetical protein